MKFLVVHPRGINKLGDEDKRIVEYEMSNIQSYDTFIQQHVGKESVNVTVGDYLFWIANPNIVVADEVEEFEVPVENDLIPNMLINELYLASGSVVITSNYAVTNDAFSGLEEQDIANIMNAFTLSGSTLVYNQYDEQVAIDDITDILLAPNGLTYDDTVIAEPELLIIDDSPPENLSTETIDSPDVY